MTIEIRKHFELNDNKSIPKGTELKQCLEKRILIIEHVS